MKRIAMLFPGQGSQHTGMGRDVYEQDSSARELFELASKWLGVDMKRLCFDAGADELKLTENAQPALLLCGVAAYRHFRKQSGIDPAFVAGHSLGELSALVAAEALSVEDGLRLARERGLAMSRVGAQDGAGMRAVTRIERERVEAVCARLDGYGSDLVIANYNAPGQCIVSGTGAALEQAGEALKACGAAIIPLKVAKPFHSPLMAPAADAFAAALDGVEFKPPRVPVIANLDARPHADPRRIAASLREQITAPVRWNEVMARLYSESVDVYLEAGPGNVLKRLALENVAGAVAYTLGGGEDQAAIEDEFAAEFRAVQEQPSLIAKCLGAAVCTRNQNWDEGEYQRGVVEPYRRLQAMQQQLEADGGEIDEKQACAALNLLAEIFATKRIPTQEQSWRFAQILDSAAAGIDPGVYPRPAAGAASARRAGV